MLTKQVAEPPAGLVNGKHPIRPNKSVCSYWIKSGDCKFGEACTYNHPPERCAFIERERGERERERGLIRKQVDECQGGRKRVRERAEEGY